MPSIKKHRPHVIQSRVLYKDDQTYNLLIVTFRFLYDYIKLFFFIFYFFLSNPYVCLDAVQYWYERLLLCRYFFFFDLDM